MHRYYENEEYGPRTRLAFLALKGVAVSMEVGTLPTEKSRTQRVLIDAVIGYPESLTHFDDSIVEPRTLNPIMVRASILQAAKSGAAHIETLTHRICDSVLGVEHALTAEVTVTRTYTWPDTEQTSLTIYKERK